MNRWDGLQEFVQVVDSGSFSEAARALGVSKSHVSKQVCRLEDRLGARLLHRTTRKLVLTDVGEAYYERCSQIVADLEEAELAATQLQATPRGTLKITVAGSFGEVYIAPAVADFLTEYPELSVVMDFSNRKCDLIEEGFDLAIRFGILQDSTLIARKIAPRYLAICASPEYLEKHGTPEVPEDLKNHNCLIGTLQNWLFKGDKGVYDFKVNGNWRSGNGNALTAAAVKGVGITQIPDFYAQEELDKGTLVKILSDYTDMDTSVWAVYPHNRHLSAKVRLFVEFLVNRFSDMQSAPSHVLKAKS